jgi:peroxiredoxin
MKRLVWITIAVGMLHACKPHTGYIIRGELADANGMKIALKKITADSDEPVLIDSCFIKKGKFKMMGTLDYPEYCGLYIGDNGPILLIVENTEINIDVNLQNIQDSKVTGSIETDLLVEYNDTIARMDTMLHQRIEYMKQFVAENPNSISAAIVINNNLKYFLDPEELEIYADGFDEEYSQSLWVQSIRERADAAKRIVIGQPFVDVNLMTPDGNEIALSDYAGKEKYVLINFWASWSKPCREANKHLVKLYKKFKDKEFEILGVSLDKNKTEWVKAIDADSLKWPQISDLKFWQSEGAKSYLVDSIPHIILLDKDGTILVKGFPSDETGKPVELEKKLKELMEELEKNEPKK